jgi:hypothetical protein
MMSEKVSEAANAHDLLSLLNAEIDLLYRASSRPGWSTWALFLGIATCGWIAVRECQLQPVDFVDAIWVVVILDAWAAGLTAINQVLEAKTQSAVRGRFRPFYEQIINSPPRVIAWVLAYVIASMIFVGSASPSWPWYVWTYLCVMGTVLGIVGICILLATCGLYAELTGSSRRSQLITNAILLAIGGSIAYCGFRFAHERWHTNIFEGATLRFGLLIWAIAQILRILLNEAQESPLLNALVTTRRELVLGKLSPAETAHRMNIIFAGMQVVDIFQSDIGEILASCSDLNAQLESATDRARRISERVLTAKPEDGLVLEAACKSVSSDFNALLTRSLAMSVKTTQLLKRLLRFKKFTPGAHAEVVDIAQRLDKQCKEHDAKVKALQESIELLRQQISVGAPQG